MKFTRIGLGAVLCAAVAVGTSYGQLRQPASIAASARAFDKYYALDDDAASPSDQPVAVANGGGGGGSAYGGGSCGGGACGGCASSSSCDSCSSCGDSGCDDCCNLGDPWSLWDEHHPCSSIHVGGWWQMGYHDNANGMFNDHPDRLNLHQGWVYFEKEADGSDCCPDWGFRFDAMYGVDAADTQAFGNDPGEWDYQNGFDHGIYGWALPQAYVDVAYGDTSIRMGHFFTLVGYEVVTAPDNFFYSHSYTMYNSEPFTHTGVLVTQSLEDDVEVYAGWTLGWDTGFDQRNQGSNFLGGFSSPLGCDSTFTYIVTGGNFGDRGDDAYGHSIVIDTAVTDRLNYVVQSDMLRVNSTGEDNFGINQYLLYTVNDCVGLGARMEWWKADAVTDFRHNGGSMLSTFPPGSHSYYNLTFGANIKAFDPNIIIRPEYRHDWAPFADHNEDIFGIDVIALW